MGLFIFLVKMKWRCIFGVEFCSPMCNASYDVAGCCLISGVARTAMRPWNLLWLSIPNPLSYSSHSSRNPQTNFISSLLQIQWCDCFSSVHNYLEYFRCSVVKCYSIDTILICTARPSCVIVILAAMIVHFYFPS